MSNKALTNEAIIAAVIRNGGKVFCEWNQEPVKHLLWAVLKNGPVITVPESFEGYVGLSQPAVDLQGNVAVITEGSYASFIYPDATGLDDLMQKFNSDEHNVAKGLIIQEFIVL